MKIKDSIKKEIIAAAVGMLSPFVENLTPTSLIAALTEYAEDKPVGHNQVRRPHTIKDVMETLQLSKPSVFKLINQGKLKRIKLGSTTRITPESLDQLILEGTGG